jgi:plasmid stability protein
MATSITIGEVPDEVREELAARAALSGRSLEEYVRDELIALARRPSAAVWMARVRARKDALQHQPTAPHAGADCGTVSGSDDGVSAEQARSVEHGSEPRASQRPLADPRRDVG